MTRTFVRAAVPLAALLALAACERHKSSNPLSPTIAGPLPGVEISQPKLLEPGQGVKFRDREQPITLLVENASTSGVRPLFYTFQIAADAGFTNVVFSKRAVPQGENGRTEVKLQDKLEQGRTYFWRAWASDGANTGPLSASTSFDIYPPVTINPPALSSPANGSTTASSSPLLTVQNAARTGPAGNVSYVFQIARDQGFAQLVAGNPGQPENLAGQTSWLPAALADATTYYWRVRATDAETTSVWSGTWSFKTPTPAPAPPPGPTPPPQGGSCAYLAGDPEKLVQCRRAQYGTRLSPAEAPGLLRLIAGDLNVGRGSTTYGLLIKTSGNNCSGFACDIICSRTGDHWDVFRDGPDATTGYSGLAEGIWLYKGTISPSNCDVR